MAAPAIIRTRQGDTVDLVAYRYYGGDTAMTVPILEANPGLAARGPVLPAGTPVTLPPAKPQTKPGIALWD